MVGKEELYAFLKIFHVLFATAWVGGALFGALIIQPLVGQSTPATRREFGGRLYPLMLRYGNIFGGFTLLTGLLLVAVTVDDWNVLLVTNWGKLILVGLLGNFFVLYLLNFAAAPTLRALEKLTANQRLDDPPSQLLVFMQKRLVFTSRLSLVILLIVLVAMVSANVGVVDALT